MPMYQVLCPKIKSSFVLPFPPGLTLRFTERCRSRTLPFRHPTLSHFFILSWLSTRNTLLFRTPRIIKLLLALISYRPTDELRRRPQTHSSQALNDNLRQGRSLRQMDPLNGSGVLEKSKMASKSIFSLSKSNNCRADHNEDVAEGHIYQAPETRACKKKRDTAGQSPENLVIFSGFNTKITVCRGSHQDIHHK